MALVLGKEKYIRDIFNLAEALCFDHADYERSYNIMRSLSLEPIDTKLESDILSRLANLNRFWKRWKEAESQIMKAISLNSENWFAQFVQVRYTADIGRKEEATLLYEQIEFPETREVRTLQQKLAAEVAIDFFEKAQSTCEVALSIRQDDAGTLYTKGILESKLDFYDKAIESFSCALVLRPDHPPARVERGLAYIKLKNYDAARIDFQEASRLSNGKANQFDFEELFGLVSVKENACV